MLTSAGCKKRFWGPLAFLRQLLEDRKISDDYYDQTTDWSVFDDVNSHLKLSILVNENRQEIAKVASQDPQSIDNLISELQKLDSFLREEIQRFENGRWGIEGLLKEIYHIAKQAELKEKEAIEKATADAFINLYNVENGTSFTVTEYSDAPDIRCQDNEGRQLNFEITLTEDRVKDIQAILGRSNHKKLESLKEHLKEVKSGKANPLKRVSCLQDNVTKMIVSRIQPKLLKDYGSNVALVIRDTSPIGWDWDMVIEQIKSELNFARNPFDKGIWIITYQKDRIYRVL